MVPLVIEDGTLMMVVAIQQQNRNNNNSSTDTEASCDQPNDAGGKGALQQQLVAKSARLYRQAFFRVVPSSLTHSPSLSLSP